MKYEDTQQKLCEKGTVMFLQEEVYMLSTCFMFVNHTKMKYIFKAVTLWNSLPYNIIYHYLFLHFALHCINN